MGDRTNVLRGGCVVLGVLNHDLDGKGNVGDRMHVLDVRSDVLGGRIYVSGVRIHVLGVRIHVLGVRIHVWGAQPDVGAGRIFVAC